MAGLEREKINSSANFSTFEFVSDTLVSGPRSINNITCDGCRVWPTGTCVDHVMDTFWGRCTEWVSFLV